MTEVVYSGPLPGVFLPNGTLCVKGEPVSVDEETAASLINSGQFKPVPKTKEKDSK